MKKLILVLGMVGLFMGSVFAAPTTHKGPIQSGSRAQGNNADVATGDGDIYAYDDIECDGDLDVAGSATFASDFNVTGDVTFDGVSNYGVSSVIQLDTATVLVVTDRYMLVVGSNTSSAELFR